MNEHLPTTIAQTRNSKASFYYAMVATCALGLIYAYGLPFTFVYDKYDEKCIDNFHLGLMIYGKPEHIERGDLLGFRNLPGIFDGVKTEVIMKRVAGVAGDRVTIVGAEVKINGHTVAQGLPLAEIYYNKTPATFSRDEIIPPGAVFMVADHPLSNDGRYWGNLDVREIRGRVIKIY